MISIHDKSVLQQKTSWLVDSKGSDPIDIRNVNISDGSLLNVEVTRKPGPVTLVNVWNLAAHGKYFVLLWPAGDAKTQSAVPKLLWDNSKCAHDILQGSIEAAARMKCDDAQIVGVRFRGFLKNGAPWKQVLQLRHGKKFVLTDCDFFDSWPDLGQQKVAGQGYVTSQKVGQVIFDGCRFHRWTDKKRGKVVSRQPGVGKIVYANCIDPDGKKFSRSE